jgi:hypothetical protein
MDKKEIMKKIGKLTFYPDWDLNPKVLAEVQRLGAEIWKNGGEEYTNMRSNAMTIGIEKNGKLVAMGSAKYMNKIIGIHCNIIRERARNNYEAFGFTFKQLKNTKESFFFNLDEKDIYQLKKRRERFYKSSRPLQRR